MARTRFESLRVYRLSEELSDALWEIVGKWDSFSKDTLGKQIVRSADSIGANLAEGEGRGSYQDNRRFIKIARGSLQETQHWLRRAYKRNLLKQEQVEKIKPLIDTLAPTLNAYLRSIGTRKSDQRNGDQLTKD
ncbi:MAG: four helix bundle protein [Acidobacteria bacterium]|nr:four helix bundle protein [Acidobacteriota bacterium]